MMNKNMRRKTFPREDDPLWYKDAIIYQLHVKTFFDSSGDGVGDFKGLTAKLEYLQDLGVTTIWLLPFCPSPLKDDGYDISHYTDIHPSYGTLSDFKRFLREAHDRGLRVITELVVNHTSDQHPWFQRARRSKPSSRRRDFYVWSDTPDRYKETRIIFQDFESSNWTWDSLAKAYYWHRFYSHQPDLNYDNPQVQKAILRVLDFWFGMGVDGLRLDAIPYLYEREGTNCENLPETHEFLKRMRAHVDSRFKNRMFLGEANQWPEDAVAYFGNGDECHMAFHFPLMPRLFMGLRMEDRFPILDVLAQTPEIPESCQWAVFLRNHDELTLEMVTDEERDYMYRVYAQDPMMRINLGIRRRLSPLLGNHRRRIELMNGLLFSSPGTPAVYYGDEIGMGDNIYLGDRNGVRTPMQWSGDRNAGFSRANPQKLYLPVIIDPEYHYEVVNVEAQQSNPHSLLWWMKRMISLRKRFKAFGRGAVEFLHPENPKILAFLRCHDHEQILVVANLSRFVQYVELDLSSRSGMIPIELFGRTEFPPIADRPYFLTLGPHTFYWFLLQPGRSSYEALEVGRPGHSLPLLWAEEDWNEIFQGKTKGDLEKIVLGYLPKRRWFGGKARIIKAVEIGEVLRVPSTGSSGNIALIRVEYLDGDEESYILPMTLVMGKEAEKIIQDFPGAAIVRLRFKSKDEEGIVLDALFEKNFCGALLDAMARRRRIKAGAGELVATSSKAFHGPQKPEGETLEPLPLKAEQSNTSVVYGQRFILKFLRRAEFAVNPDLEIGRFLTERDFSHTPPVAGALEYRRENKEPMTVAILQAFVPNHGDAWAYTLDILNHYLEEILAQQKHLEAIPTPKGSIFDLAMEEPSAEAHHLIGPYLEMVRLLGQRTGELHVVLASASNHPAFCPEPFSKLYQRSLYQSMRTLAGRIFPLLRNRLGGLPETLRPEAKKVLDLEKEIQERFKKLLDYKIKAKRIRCHGDYHLGQVLFTGKDFVIFDFEGEPARPISERRIKRSPLRDVAGMLRSFHYAVCSALSAQEAQGLVHPEDREKLERWSGFWNHWVCAVFLKAYLEAASSGSFLPEKKEELQVLLDVYLLEKAVYELGYELNNRPDWVKIPLKAITQLLAPAA